MDASIPLLEKYPLPVSGLTSERNFSLSHLQGGQAGNRCLSSLHFRRSAIKTINLRYCYLYYTGNMFDKLDGKRKLNGSRKLNGGLYQL